MTQYAFVVDAVVRTVGPLAFPDLALEMQMTPEVAAQMVALTDAQAGTVKPGWSYSAGKFTAPAAVPPAPPVVPRTVTNFQARAAMMQVPGSAPGKTLFDEVNAALLAGRDASPEGAVAWQAWQVANDFYRDGTLINQLAAGFGQSPTEIDALFVAASTINA